MSKARTLASLIADGAIGTSELADGAVTSAKIASGAAVANIGYTPVNKAGDTISGRLVVSGGYSDGVIERRTRVISAGASNVTYRIAWIARHYWGAGPVFLSVTRSYYSSFRRSRYFIEGDTKVADGDSSIYITTEYNSNAVNAPFVGPTYFDLNSGPNRDQYVDIRITVPSYAQYVLEWECMNIAIYDNSNVLTHSNAIAIFPSPVAV